jgi:transaldolase
MFRFRTATPSPETAMSAENNITKAKQLGQSIWLDSISRDMLRSGELKKLVQQGVSGVTSNPSIFEKAIAESSTYDSALVGYSTGGASVETIFERLAVDDIRDAADVLRPVYDANSGKDGFVSIEVSPRLAFDTNGTVEEARRLWKTIDRPNVMIKVPGTPEGMPAIRTLISDGINVNVTLLFSINAYKDAASAYIQGVRDYMSAGKGSPMRIASVASFFVSRVDTAVDKQLGADHKLAGKAGIANARVAYGEFKRLFDITLGSGNFHPLATTGAQVQRPLWASTSVKNPKYPDTMYVDELMGPQTVNTLPGATLDAMVDHGTIENRLDPEIASAQAHMDAIAAAGLSIDAITDDLLKAGVKAFADSYDSLLAKLGEKLGKLSK